MAPTQLTKIVVEMEGFPGAPGYMTFYGGDPTLLQPAVVAFVNTVKTNFPSDVTFTVPNEGILLMDDGGDLAGTWTAGTATTIVGTGVGGYAAPAGACITWRTGRIVGRRALKGRTFLVPLTGAAFDTDGSIIPVSLGVFRTAAATLFAAAGLRVWHRPTSLAARDGVSWPVTGSAVADKAAVLRSRRA